jgi:hypothetical protein
MYARILLTVIGLATGAIHDTSVAQTRKGAPQELLGVFGSSRDQCLAFHRKIDDIHRLSKDFYSWCSGSGCEARVVSHRTTKRGYVLRFASPGNPEGWSVSFRRVRQGVYETRADDDPETETLSRCRDEDMIAGIGLDPAFPPGSSNAANAAFASFKAEIKSPAAIFSAHYALAVPRHCPDLLLRREAAEAIVEVGRQGWLRFIQEKRFDLPSGRTYEGEAEDFIARDRRQAEGAVEADAALIKDFCRHVVDVFGPQGRVIPGLMAP